MSTKPVLRSIDAVIEILEQNKANNVKAVEDVLEIYKKTKEKYLTSCADHASKSKHPLIVFEGLDGCGKSTLAREVSARLNAKQWRTPPNSLKHIRSEFDSDPQLSTAFYGLGNYIAAMEVSSLLQNSPVVLDRFWHSSAAYGIAQAIEDNPDLYKMPPEGADFYQWPSDLLQPDIVILYQVEERERLRRISRRKECTDQELLLKNSETFRNNIMLAYKNMFYPEVTIINGNQDVASTLNLTLRKLLPLFPQLT